MRKPLAVGGKGVLPTWHIGLAYLIIIWALWEYRGMMWIKIVKVISPSDTVGPREYCSETLLQIMTKRQSKKNMGFCYWCKCISIYRKVRVIKTYSHNFSWYGNFIFWDILYLAFFNTLKSTVSYFIKYSSKYTFYFYQFPDFQSWLRRSPPILSEVRGRSQLDWVRIFSYKYQIYHYGLYYLALQLFNL